MAKRVFERRDGLLLDRYEDPPGQKCTYQGPASRLGESPEQARNLTAIAGEEGAAPFTGVLALMDDRSPELLESLLHGLASGNSAAPNALLRFLDDPRVRPALVAAAAIAPASSLANYTQAVGIAGGAGASEVLLTRLEEIAAASDVMAHDDFFNDLAGSLASTAHALLRLDRDSEPAARALVRLLDHPCAFNRRSAIREAADALDPRSSTRAMEILRSALDRQIDNARDDEFISAGPALVHTMPDPFLARCEKILEGDDPLARDSVLSHVSQLDSPKALALAVRGFSRFSSFHRAVGIAPVLAPLMPASDVSALIRRSLAHESPSLRFHAIEWLLPLVDPRSARELATEALVDEPDEGLRRALQRVVDHGA